MIEYKYIALASGAYLCESLPPVYVEWTEEFLYAWIEDNAWEPLVNTDGARIWDAIDSLAWCIERFCNE